MIEIIAAILREMYQKWLKNPSNGKIIGRHGKLTLFLLLQEIFTFCWYFSSPPTQENPRLNSSLGTGDFDLQLARSDYRGDNRAANIARVNGP